MGLKLTLVGLVAMMLLAGCSQPEAPSATPAEAPKLKVGGAMPPPGLSPGYKGDGSERLGSKAK